MAPRVLYVHGSATRYGADQQLLALAGGLDPTRYEPLVVLPEPGPLSSMLELAGVETHYAPLAVLKRSMLRGRDVAGAVSAKVRAKRALVGLARTRDVAIVHTNSSIVLTGADVAAGVGAAHVVHVREIYAGAGGTAGRALWPLLRRRLLRADALACVSAAAAAQFDGSGRAFVIHDGLVRRNGASPRASARAALGLPPDRFVAAVIGRISDWKSQDDLARALHEGPLRDIGAIGLVAGDTAPGQEHYERALLTLGDQLGLGARLRILGFRDDVENLLGAADAVVVPSRRPDALPNSAIEAGAAGVPLVVTDNGGLPEIVRDGLSGRLVAPGDVAGLAAALRQIADEPGWARQLGAAASADVRRRFGATRMLEEMQACYDRLTA